MTLQTPATAKTASDAAIIFTDETGSLVVTAINAAVTTQSTRTDTEERLYRACIDIDCTAVEGQPIKLIQSDETEVNLFDVEETLKAAGYRVHYRIIVTREGKNDKIKLALAWD